MANELDKTIEELEAEVIAELEEGAHDAPKKGAMGSEPMKKKPSDGATGEEDIGGSTPSKVSPPTGKDASKSSKEVSGDAQQRVKVNQTRFKSTKVKMMVLQVHLILNLLQWVIQMTKSENFVILKTMIVQQP